MAYVVEWSELATSDLEEIVAHLDQRSSVASGRVLEAIRSAMLTIASSPNIGRIVPEFADPVRRETFVFEYRVIYRVNTGRVVVLRIVHGRRLLRNVSGSFEERDQAEYVPS